MSARAAGRKKSTASPQPSKLRLPGKLADCSEKGPDETELFIVEGDSAGGSRQAGPQPENAGHPAAARQDPERESASLDKLMANQEINDLAGLALGTQLGKKFAIDDLRYERSSS
jgi:topoisomerase-4 subunit B